MLSISCEQIVSSDQNQTFQVEFWQYSPKGIIMGCKTYIPLETQLFFTKDFMLNYFVM